MQKLITLRFALPTIVILAIVTIAIVAFTVAVNAHHGAAATIPCC